MATNIYEVFGDWVRINGSHTLAEGYQHLSRVMNWAANNVYAGSNDIYYSALQRAYLDMAEYSKLISNELTVNPSLFYYNKAVQNSLALLLDPTYYMSTNWWLRLTIKSAIYTAAMALLSHWYNPKIVTITSAALVAALVIISPALAPDILGLAFATGAIVIYIEAGRLPWWLGWLRPILEGIAWAFENIGAIISLGAVWKYRAFLWAKPFLWTLGIWLIIDYSVEQALDHFNLLRDY